MEGAATAACFNCVCRYSENVFDHRNFRYFDSFLNTKSHLNTGICLMIVFMLVAVVLAHKLTKPILQVVKAADNILTNMVV